MVKRSDGISKIEDIDERDFLSILDGRATPSGLPNKDRNISFAPAKEVVAEEIKEEEGKEEPKEKEVVSKRSYKKKKNREYLDVFLKPRVLKQRQCVYVGQDVHEFISKIINKLNVKNLTVGVFIDTVMTEHIKDHTDDLRAIYYKEEKDIFKIIDNNDNE